MILLLASLLIASDAADMQRAAWQYRRPVQIRASDGLASLTLPLELSEKAGPLGRDLRLVDSDGKETPYLLEWTREGEGLATWQAGIGDIRREREGGRRASPVRSQWTIDLGQPRTFTELNLNVPDSAFAWHVRVETSTDGDRYEVVESDAALFDQVWNGERVRKTDIRLESVVTARYLRIVARSASTARVLDFEGASVTLRRALGGTAWSREISAEPVEMSEAGREGVTRYRLQASSLLPFDEVEIMADDSAFARGVRLIEAVDGAGRVREELLGQGRIFRLRSGDSVVAGESVRFRTRNGVGGTLYLEVDNAASPPLRELKVRLHGSRLRLLFPASGHALSLYYGNPATRAPTYDLETLRPRMAQTLPTAFAEVGAEAVNPHFLREPPLRFAAVLGASLDPAPWQHERALAPVLAEDVYTLTLKAEDLAASRPDLADLRVVNEDDRQVPFLIERDFSEERIPLSVEHGPSKAPGRSHFQLLPPGTLPRDGAVRLSGIELGIADAFFERPARLISVSGGSRRERTFHLALARRPPASGPLWFATTATLGPVRLEVDDGDNAPLEIGSAVAVVRVPRLVFKSAPGTLRLLLGNPEAEPPRYDLAGLRRELLAYSALPANAFEIVANPSKGSAWFSSLPGASSGAMVWGGIIAAMLVLLALTLRTIRSV